MKKKLNGYLLAGLIITGVMLLITVIGIFWTPYVPTAMKYGRFQPPSFRHLFGTDNFGRDIFSRVIKGSGTTLAIALSTVSIGAIVGTLVGAVTGYFGGLVDDVLMRLNDTLTAFPSFLLVLLVVSLVGPGKNTVWFWHSAWYLSRVLPASCGRSLPPCAIKTMSQEHA